MALNPEISLGIRPQQPVALPPVTSPLDRYQKVLTLRHLMQQGQLGQMNIEQTRLENERLQRTAQDEQSLGSWMQQNQQRPDLTPQEIVAAHPNPTGIKFATAWSAQKTAELTQHKAFLDNAFEEAKTDDRIYNSVTPKDPQSKYAALTELVRLKRLTGEQAAHIAGLPDSEFEALQKQAAAQSLDRLQRIKVKQDEIALRIAQATEGAQIEGAVAEGAEKKTKSLREELATAGQTAPDNQAEWDPWRAKFSKQAQGFIPAMFSSAALQTVQKTALPLKAAVPGVDVPFSQDVLEQKIRVARAGVPGTEGDAALIQSIKANPSLWQDIQPKTQERIAPTLAAQGFTQFGKPATDAERRVLNFYDRMLDATNTLEATTVDEKGNKVPSLEQWVENLGKLGQGRLALAPDWGQTAEGQAYNQALRQFTEARLRKESGAVIGPNEFAESRRTFFPVPGDQPRVLEQKRQARKKLVQSMQEEAGAAYVEREGKKQRTGGPPPPGGKYDKGSDPGGLGLH